MQVREALSTSLSTIVSAIKDTVEDSPPELSADIAERGIMLCGGGSLISGLPKLVSSETRMPVSVASEPLSCVAKGTCVILENSEFLKKLKMNHQTFR